LSLDGYCDRHPRKQQESDARRQRRALDSPETKKQRAFYHSAIWQRIRIAVISRDGICQECRVAAALEAHHIIPIAAGGEKLSLENLVGLCRPCHSKRTRAENAKH
jgi:5-methylcytosine-specific restriction endonuclease McrA